MANTVTMNGHFNFHYDEALGRTRVIIPPSLALELSEGHPLINLNGMLNSNFVVQYSTNLVGTNWMNLLSLTNLPYSPYQFLDPAGASEPARFYRALMQ